MDAAAPVDQMRSTIPCDSGPDRQKRRLAELLRGRTPVGAGTQTSEQGQGGVSFAMCREKTKGNRRAPDAT
jgi:hypothetical protein